MSESSDRFTLPSDFIKKNPLPPLTSGEVNYAFMVEYANDRLGITIELTLRTFPPKRRARIERERKEIRALEKAEDVVMYLKKRDLEEVSRQAVVDKIVEMGGEVYSLILDQLDQMVPEIGRAHV